MIRKAQTAAVKSVPAKKNTKSAKKDESMLTQMEEAVETGAKAVMNAAVGLFDYVEEGLGMKAAKKKKSK